MKIIIETDRSNTKPTYKIKVSDGSDFLQEKVANTIEERDSIVWNLAQLYNVDDIEFVDMKVAKEKKHRVRLSETPVIEYEGEASVIDFIENNQHLVCNRILEAIEEGLYYGLNKVKVIQLGDTGIALTSDRSDWVHGLEAALHYFESTEDYEGCLIASSLIKQLRNETNTTDICD